MSIAKTALKGVTHHDKSKTTPGYTLFSTYNHDVWLIDMDGYIVHRWRMPYRPGAHQVLLPNGNLLFAGVLKDHTQLGLPAEMAAIGGILIEVDWDSNLVWKAVVPYQNHDLHPLANGHVLYHSYHPNGILPAEMAARLTGGLRGTEFKGQVWGDMVHEIDRDGNVVWEWAAKDHLDPVIDGLCPLENRTLWPYINSVWQCRDGSILLSLRASNEVVRVAYPGGQVLARYGRGQITHQHDARELENGNILVFDNGSHRREYAANHSRVVEIAPDSGQIVWQYQADMLSDFYSPVCSGNERLPNGNTVICESWHGRIFEVTYDGHLVWEYNSPFVGSIVGMTTTMMWRAHRYLPDYPGLQGKPLDPGRLWPENRLYGPPAWGERVYPSVF